MKFGTHTNLRILVLCLLAQTGSLQVQELHNLLFGLGMSEESLVNKHALLGLTFLRDEEGPVSLELGDLLRSLHRDGYLEMNSGYVEVTEVGLATAERAESTHPHLFALASAIAADRPAIAEHVEGYFRRRDYKFRPLGDVVFYVPKMLVAEKEKIYY